MKNSTKSTITNAEKNAEYLALCIERGRIRREAKNAKKSNAEYLTHCIERAKTAKAKKSAKITKLPTHCKDTHGSHKLGLSDAKFAKENYPKGNVASDIAYVKSTIREDEIFELALTADERRELNIAIGGEVFNAQGNLIS